MAAGGYMRKKLASLLVIIVLLLITGCATYYGDRGECYGGCGRYNRCYSCSQDSWHNCNYGY